MLSTPNMKGMNKDINRRNEISLSKNEMGNSGSKFNNLYKLSEAEEDIPSFHRTLIFIFFLLSNLFLNYDTGVIPAALIEITKEINLDYTEQALIGSLVYLGLSFASLFVGYIFSKFSPSKVCSLVLLLNCLSCFIFSLTSIKIILFTMRFLMGATEAFIVIYGPVWVNNFSPLEYSTTWMGILHSCTVLGVVTGYVSASIIINFFSNIFTWRFSIQIQGFADILFALFFWFENDDFIKVDVRKTISANEMELENRNSNVNNNNQFNTTVPRGTISSNPLNSRMRNRRYNPRIDSIETSNLGGYFFQAKTVLKTPLYITITFGMCSIYFIVTGIQLWMTKYLIEILEGEQLLVNTIFSIISITAPLFLINMVDIKEKMLLKLLKCVLHLVSFLLFLPFLWDFYFNLFIYVFFYGLFYFLVLLLYL